MSNPSPHCTYCGSPKTVKRGVRATRKGNTQVYHCKKCSRRFSISALPCYTFPAEVILSAPVYYSLGYSIRETRKRIMARFNQAPSMAAVAKWIKEFSALSAMKKFRSKIIAFDRPHRIIRRKLLSHRQNYLFQIHRFKLSKVPPEFSGLTDYLNKIMSGEIIINPDDYAHRASECCLGMRFSCTTSQGTYPCKLASCGIKAASANHGRHLALQRFFLGLDLSTVATEVPVYLTSSETGNTLKRKGGLLGHIDFLQVFNTSVNILDYKPDASKETRAHEQLLLYALALSLRTGIHLKHITCAWFDENRYFHFPAMAGYLAFKSIAAHFKIF